MGEFTLINRGHFSHSESHPSGGKEEKHFSHSESHPSGGKEEKHFSHSESHPSGGKEEKCVQLESQDLFLLFVKSLKKIFLGTKEHFF